LSTDYGLKKPELYNMGLQFQHKEFAWLFGAIALFALLFFFLIRWKQKTKKRIGDPKLVDVLTAGYSPLLFTLKYVFLAVAFGAGVLAVMNLREPAADETSSRKGIDVVIALDVSKSMLATDLQPNRLERAKQLIAKLMNAMPNDRIGLVVFAGRAYLQMPLTTDYGAAMLFVSSTGPDAVPQQGTVISEALKQSSNAFNTMERRFKTVVLISDGEDHDEEAIKTAKALSEEGMMINTVGIGSPEGSYIPDSVTGENKKDATGNFVVSRLNEDELKQIAATTNGTYIRLQDSDEAVHLLLQQFSGIEKKAFGDVSLMNFKTYYWWFAVIMFVLLLSEYFIPEIKKKLAI
jgi:Ca-activated chloride channel family protein